MQRWAASQIMGFSTALPQTKTLKQKQDAKLGQRLVAGAEYGQIMAVHGRETKEGNS